MLKFTDNFRDVNAAIAILASLYLLLNSINIFLDGSITWTVYSLIVLLFVFLPGIIKRDPTAFPPFEILVYLAIPFTLKGMELGFIASHTLNYLSAAGIALLIVTELDTYTSFRTDSRFAVWLVSLTTIAVAGFWAVGRWLSHLYLDTPLGMTEHSLMWEFVAAGMAGIIAGKIFSIYFRRKDRRLESK